MFLNKGEIMLIECRECKKQVSDLATACPSCGAPIRSVPTSDSPSINKILENRPNLIDRSYVLHGGIAGLVLGFILLIIGIKPGNMSLGGFIFLLFVDTPFILIGAVIGAAIKKRVGP